MSYWARDTVAESWNIVFQAKNIQLRIWHKMYGNTVIHLLCCILKNIATFHVWVYSSHLCAFVLPYTDIVLCLLNILKYTLYCILTLTLTWSCLTIHFPSKQPCEQFHLSYCSWFLAIIGLFPGTTYILFISFIPFTYSYVNFST